MVKIADGDWDERMARAALSVLAEPDDSVTGRMLARLGGVETLRLLDRDDLAPDLDAVETQMWRQRLLARTASELRETVAGFEGRGFGIASPGDDHWPAALADLSEHAPYVLWMSGASSFLTRPLDDLVTVTGARASTGYGEFVTTEIAADLSSSEKVVVAGGAYGIEGAAHRAALAAGGDTIAVLAAGVDRFTQESLSGFIASDAQLTHTAKGDRRFYARVGQEHYRREQDGSFSRVETTYHHLVMFGRSAEHAQAQFARGDNFVAEGYIRHTSYEKDGQNIEGEELVAKKIGHDTARTSYEVDRTSHTAAGAASPVVVAGRRDVSGEFTASPVNTSVQSSMSL